MRHGVSAAIALLVLVVATASAQTPTGTLQGTIFDPSQSVLPNATVRITNVATNEEKALKTDVSGHYLQPFLIPGTYAITAEAQGFAKTRQENVKLDVSQNRTVDLVLQVGAAATEVVVTAPPPVLETNTSTLGQLIENKRVVDLPLNGRNAMALAALSAGVISSSSNSVAVNSEGTPHMGGSRNAVNEAQLDGMSIIAPENNVGVNKLVYSPPIDAIQEFSVQINALSAEYGRFGGGVINIVTKSGTNSLHGSGYVFMRNSVLNANDFFSNKNGQAKADTHDYQYGGSVGGPVIKNRTFFFFDLQEERAASPSLFSGSVPPEAWRSGNFSSFDGTIYDPRSGHACTPGAGGCPAEGWIRSPFAGNQIPVDAMDPVAVKAIKYFPQANSGAGAPTNNFFNPGTTAVSAYDTDTRIDHNVTNNWRMFARVSHHKDVTTPPNNFGDPELIVAEFSNWNGGGPQNTTAWSTSLDNTISLSPTLILNLRYGFGQNNVHRTPYSDGFDITTLGLPSQLAAAAQTQEFPRFEIGGHGTGYPEILGNEGWSRYYMVPNVHDTTATVSKILNRHTVKTGFEYRKLFMNFAQFAYPTGRWGFDDSWTQRFPTTSDGSGNGVASFLLGLPSWGGHEIDPPPATANSYWAGYVQDDFKVSSKLTLNLGVRYELETPRTERHDHLSYFDPTLPSPLAGVVPADACSSCGNLMGQMVFVNTPGAKYGRHQVPLQKHNFSPRIGLAWSPTKDWVVRSGFGIAYAPSPFQAAGGTGGAGLEGYLASTGWRTSVDGNRTFADRLSTAFYSGGPNPINFPQQTPSTNLGNQVDQSFFTSFASTYSEQWNLNVQRELPGSVTFEAGYLGNRGVHLPWGNGNINLSQLPASYLSLGAALLDVVPNPFYGVAPGSVGSTPTTTRNNLLRPYPQYSTVASFRKPMGNSLYNGFTLRADKRFSKGLSFLLTYTAGKVLSDTDSAVGFLGRNTSNSNGGNNGGPADAYNLRNEWAVDAQDVSQSFVSSFVYDLPFGKGRSFLNSMPHVANLIVSGWQVNGIMTFQTGTPVTMGGGTVDNGLGTNKYRLSSTGKSAKVSNQSIDRWFDPTAFTQPAPFTIGNLGRTLPDVRNPGIATCDFSLFKNTRFGPEERYTVQIRTEWFNALNTPQFDAPGTGFPASSTGVVSATAHPGRVIQMAAKFIF